MKFSNLTAFVFAIAVTATAFAEQASENGGIIRRPGVQKGRVLVLNGQEKVAASAFGEVIAELGKSHRIEFKVKNGRVGADAKSQIAAMGEESAQIAIFIVDDAEQPITSAVYPDQHFALLNVAGLGEVNADKRLSVLLARTFYLLGGAANSQFANAFLKPINKPDDLDAIDWHRVPVDVLNKCTTTLPSLGITPYVETTYLEACVEGWAPAPTNDVQKAIWKEVKDPASRWDKDFGGKKK